MSFPGKENLIFFETLASKQTQIWDDACDLGTKLAGKTFGDIALKDAARTNLMELMAIYAYKMTKSNGPSRCTETDIFIPFEFDDGAYQGVNLHVAFTVYKKEECLLVNIQSARKTHAEANADEPMYKEIVGENDQEPIEFNAGEYGSSDEGAYLAEQGRSNPNAWAEAAYDAQRFN